MSDESSLLVPDEGEPLPTEKLISVADLRPLLLQLRQKTLIELGALEDFLQMERSVTPKRKRK